MSKICCHCGASQSVCWRRGPEDKPLLCNACGARYLVKRSLDGYLPHSRPTVSRKLLTAKQSKSSRKQLGVRSSTAQLKIQARSSRSARSSPKGSTDSLVSRVSRGTQTIPLFLPSIATFQEIGSQTSKPPSLFTVAAAKHMQVQSCAGEDFSGLAVSALTLLRRSDKDTCSADLGAVTPTQIVRKHPRKPAKATIRALF